MINIVITAGGTSEDIDGVRKITNLGTGTLSSCICEEISKSLSKYDYHIYYIMSENSNKSFMDKVNNDNISIIKVSNVNSVYESVVNVLTLHKCDYFIHAMAISDFTTDYLIRKKDLACEICEELMDANRDFDSMYEIVKSILEKPKYSINLQKKVSSKEELLIGLKRTQKVINIIKKISPNTKLIGFKLLNAVDDETLYNRARELIEINSCDYVIANDIKNINENKHRALLIKDKIVKEFLTKKEIARGIVNIIKDDENG